jgi:hypothetical protein
MVTILECDVKHYKWFVLFMLKHQIEDFGYEGDEKIVRRTA